MLLVGSGVVATALLIGLVGSGRATFPGADGEVVFQNPDGGAFYTVKPDGSQLTKIPGTGAFNGINADPSFGGSGRRIVFSHTTSPDGDLSSIVYMDPDGSNRHTVIRRKGFHFFDPSFSPGGGRIVFVLNDAIFAVRTSGTHLHKLADTRGFDRYPSYSPGGKLIVWNAGFRILLMRADGTHRRVVARGPHFGEPSFSPAGKRILFTGGPSGSSTPLTDVLEMNLDGTGLHHVTNDAGASVVYHTPHFSPAGTRIVVVRKNPSPECNNCESLQIMNANGGNPHPLAETKSAVTPDWGPAVSSPYP